MARRPLHFTGPAASARAWVAERFAGWFEALTPSQAGAVADYKGSAYEDINGLLREPDFYLVECECEEREHYDDPCECGGEMRVWERINELDAALSIFRIPEAITLWRLVVDYDGVFDEAEVGDEFVEPGFLSTTLHKPLLGTFKSICEDCMVVLRIHVPAGATTAGAPDLVIDQSETEILLPRDSRLLIHKIEHRSGTAPGDLQYPYMLIETEVV